MSLPETEDEMGEPPKPKQKKSPSTVEIDGAAKKTPTRKRTYTKRKTSNESTVKLPSVNQAMDFLKKTFNDGSTVFFVIPAVTDNNGVKK